MKIGYPKFYSKNFNTYGNFDIPSFIKQSCLHNTTSVDKLAEQLNIRRNKMSKVIEKNYEEFKISILAPGASKNNVKITKDIEERKLIVICKPEVEIPEVDLEVKEQIDIPKMYKMSKVKASVTNGIITIKVSVDEDRMQKVEVE